MKLSFKRIMDLVLEKTKIGSVFLLFSTLILLTGCGTSAYSPNGEYQYENATSVLGDAGEIIGDINDIKGVSSDNSKSTSDWPPPAIAPGAFPDDNTQNPKPQSFSSNFAPHKSYNNVNISGETHKTYPANTSLNKMLDDSNKQLKNNIKEELKNQN